MEKSQELDQRNRDFLMQVYQECHEYVRQQPKYRDQIILFYMAICSFYLTHYDEGEKAIFLIFSLAMVVLGAVCSVVVISFRSWIIQYNNATEAVGRVLTSDDSISSRSKMVNMLEDECKNKARPERPFLCRAGNIIVVGFCTITLIPFAACAILFREYGILVLLTGIALGAVYYTLLILFCRKQISKAEDMGTKTWIIRFCPAGTQPTKK